MKSRMLIVLAPFLTLLSLAQTPDVQAGAAGSQTQSSKQGAEIHGVVRGSGGKPLEGVDVYTHHGKTISTKTDSKGEFTLRNQGGVLHFEKEGLQRQVVAPGPATPSLQVTMKLEASTLHVPPCEKPAHGQKQIGWMAIRFSVPTGRFKITGGKWDVDYVVYVIKPRNSASDGKTASWLELWFGPYAIGMEPDDDQFLKSVSFEQQMVAFASGSGGIDSRGILLGGGHWRRVGIGGMGGAIYNKATAADSELFDKVIDSICEAPVQ